MPEIWYERSSILGSWRFPIDFTVYDLDTTGISMTNLIWMVCVCKNRLFRHTGILIQWWFHEKSDGNIGGRLMVNVTIYSSTMDPSWVYEPTKAFHGWSTSPASPRYEVLVASMSVLGLVRGTKTAAQQSAAERALVALQERPELVPQDGAGATWWNFCWENIGKPSGELT